MIPVLFRLDQWEIKSSSLFVLYGNVSLFSRTARLDNVYITVENIRKNNRDFQTTEFFNFPFFAGTKLYVSYLDEVQGCIFYVPNDRYASLVVKPTSAAQLVERVYEFVGDEYVGSMWPYTRISEQRYTKVITVPKWWGI